MGGNKTKVESEDFGFHFEGLTFGAIFLLAFFIFPLESEETPYEEIFGENVRKIRKIYEILKENLLKCEKLEIQGIQIVDPLYECTAMEINWLIDLHGDYFIHI